MRIDGYSVHAQLVCSPEDSHSDLRSVCDEEFVRFIRADGRMSPDMLDSVLIRLIVHIVLVVEKLILLIKGRHAGESSEPPAGFSTAELMETQGPEAMERVAGLGTSNRWIGPAGSFVRC